MKRITFLLLMFFSYLSTFGQSLPKLSERLYYEEFTPDSIILSNHTFYKYNGDGLIENKIRYTYQDTEISVTSGDFYEYNNANLLMKKLHRRKSEVVDLWLTISWIDYFYDNNGCIAREEYTHNTVDNKDTTLYVRDFNCNLLEYWNSRQPEIHLKYEYLDTLGSYIESIERDERIVQTSEYIYNEYGFIENVKKNYYSDTVQQIITYWSEIDYRYNYTFEAETGFLINIHREIYRSNMENPLPEYSGDYEWSYDYYCYGLKKYFRPKLGGNIIKWKYEGLNDCFDKSRDKIEVIVFPNPTYGQLTIESPILESGNTRIQIFGLDGRNYYDWTSSQISTLQEFDFSFLNNGVYLIYLSSSGSFATSKLIIAK